MKRYLHEVNVLLFLLLILSVSVMALMPMQQFEFNQQTTILDGGQARELERYYDQRFPVRDMGTNVWAAIDYLLFGEGRQGVQVGRNGWLFSTEEIHAPVDAEQHLARNLSRIQQVTAQFARAGVHLSIALLPSKVRMQAGQWGEGINPEPLMTDLYDQALVYLQDLPVVVPDLRAALGEHSEPVFLRTDTHWTPLGADLVARTVVQALSKCWPEHRGDQPFKTRVLAARTHRGDLLNYIPVSPWLEWAGPEADQLASHQTSLSAATAVSDHLFGDTDIQVALVGTSYSANSAWNFAGALREHLQQDLLNVAQEGKGPFQPMEQYLASPEWQARPPALVVWEIPERYLVQAPDSLAGKAVSH